MSTYEWVRKVVSNTGLLGTLVIVIAVGPLRGTGWPGIVAMFGSDVFSGGTGRRGVCIVIGPMPSGESPATKRLPGVRGRLCAIPEGSRSFSLPQGESVRRDFQVFEGDCVLSPLVNVYFLGYKGNQSERESYIIRVRDTAQDARSQIGAGDGGVVVFVEMMAILIL